MFNVENLTIYGNSINMHSYYYFHFSAATSTEEKRAFLDHIEQTKLVTNQLTTPRVVKMIGCVTLHEPHCLVTELPARGDLLTYLVNCRENVSLSPSIIFTSFLCKVTIFCWY